MTDMAKDMALVAYYAWGWLLLERIGWVVEASLWNFAIATTALAVGCGVAALIWRGVSAWMLT